MLFLTLSGVDVDFLDRNLRWRIYNTQKAFPTTFVELVGKKKFAAAALNPEYETYVVHVRQVSSVTLLNSFLLREFQNVVLDQESETFIVLVTSLSFITLPSFSLLNIHEFAVAPLTSILKTSGNTEFTIRPRKGRVGVVGNGGSGDDSGHDDEHSPQSSEQAHQ